MALSAPIHSQPWALWGLFVRGFRRCWHGGEDAGGQRPGRPPLSVVLMGGATRPVSF